MLPGFAHRLSRRVGWDAVRMAQQLAPDRVRLGGLTRRPRPFGGGRPTVRFAIAVVAHGRVGRVQRLVVSAPWRSDLREAIGPVMAWVIPILLAYVPGVVIGFLAVHAAHAPLPRPVARALQPGRGRRASGPPVTVVVAAWNEERGIGPTLERDRAARPTAGPLEVVLADNNSTDRTAEARRRWRGEHGLDYRRVFEPRPASTRRSTRRSRA